MEDSEGAAAASLPPHVQLIQMCRGAALLTKASFRLPSRTDDVRRQHREGVSD